MPNFRSEMNRYKEEQKESLRDQQGRHEAEMARLHDLIIELNAQVEAMSAQRSVAQTIVTDNRAETIWNTDGVPKKQSNSTPEQGGNGVVLGIPEGSAFPW